MKAFNTFAMGLDLANNAFKLAWKHKQLFFYSAIATLLLFAIGLSTYFFVDFPSKDVFNILNNTNFNTFITNIAHTTSIPLKYGIVGLVFCIVVAISTFLYVALAKHTQRIIEHQHATIGQSLFGAMHKLPTIFLITLLSCIPLLLHFFLPNSWPTSIIQMIWDALFILVVPICALYHISLLHNIKTAVRIGVQHILPLIGGSIWIGIATALVALMALTPLLVIGIFTRDLYNSADQLPLWFSISILIIILPLKAYVLEAQWIFGVLMVDRFYKENK